MAGLSLSKEKVDPGRVWLMRVAIIGNVQFIVVFVLITSQHFIAHMQHPLEFSRLELELTCRNIIIIIIILQGTGQRPVPVQNFNF
jgi:hypothetical protein